MEGSKVASPRVSFIERDDSDESSLEDIFENDDVNEEDFVHRWEEASERGTSSTLNVGEDVYGCGQSRPDRTSGSSGVQQTAGNAPQQAVTGVCGSTAHPGSSSTTEGYLFVKMSAPILFFTNKLSFRGWLRWFFVRNTSTRLAIAIVDFILKILICAFYVIRVELDDISQYECNGSACASLENSTESERDRIFEQHEVNWYVLIWVQRSSPVWTVEISLAFVELIKSLLMVFIATKGHRMEQVLSLTFILELLCGVNMLITLVPVLKSLFVPVYLNCWLARLALERIYNDLHLTSQRFQTVSVRLTKKMILLVMNIACLTFTTLCTIQHIQRASADKQISLFDSFYFVVVTFSTVGFGDIAPDMWLSRLFMVIMICLAFATLPCQIEGMIIIYREREKAGGEYREWFTTKKHVIVCASSMTQETLMDFLNEFYVNPKLEERTVILLCCQELDSGKRVITTDPRWSEKVIYMQGSALKDMDLSRCHAQQAYACFFLAPRPTKDKAMADRHTILRSWAVKDFAPNCKQYVYLFKAVNRLNVKYAEHVMCEDEFSFALLANNCLYPGLSTLVSLLVHSTKEQQKGMVLESWQQLYGRHSANEIFHVQAQKSIIFSHYLGQTFPRTSADAHFRYGVALLAVLDSESLVPRLQLNPGPHYRLKAADMLFYMSLAREEYSKTNPCALNEATSGHRVHVGSRDATEDSSSPEANTNNTHALKNMRSVFDRITRLLRRSLLCVGRPGRRNRRPDDATDSGMGGTQLDVERDSRAGSSQPLSQSCSVPLLKEFGKKSSEDSGQMRWRERKCGVAGTATNDEEEEGSGQEGHHLDLRHGEGRVLQFYEDMERVTMGAPPVTTCTGVGRAICHVRTKTRDLCCLEWGKSCQHCSYKNVNDKRWDSQLIILVAEHASSGMFNFIVPLRSSSIGVNGLSPIILVLEEEPDCLFLDSLAHFPLVYYMIGTIKSIDDLLVAGVNKASHLVIVNRDPEYNSDGEEYLEDSETVVAVQTISRLFPNAHILTALSQTSNMRFIKYSVPQNHSQKQFRDSTTSILKEIFRLPFAAGHVFSANMLDTLLYQTFTKGYLISFVRLLLGIDSEEGSGHLSSIQVKKATVRRFPEYRNLYDWLSQSTGEIPFAIYRTERVIKEDLKPACGDEFFDLGDEKVRSKPRKFSTEKQENTLIKGYKFSAACKSSPDDLGGLIRSRLQSLDMTQGDYSEVKFRRDVLSYVITNPSPSETLRVGDTIYVIQPSSMSAKPSRQQHFLRRSQSAPRMSASISPKGFKRSGGVLKSPSREGYFDAGSFGRKERADEPRISTATM